VGVWWWCDIKGRYQRSVFMVVERIVFSVLLLFNLQFCSTSSDVLSKLMSPPPKTVCNLLTSPIRSVYFCRIPTSPTQYSIACSPFLRGPWSAFWFRGWPWICWWGAVWSPCWKSGWYFWGSLGSACLAASLCRAGEIWTGGWGLRLGRECSRESCFRWWLSWWTD